MTDKQKIYHGIENATRNLVEKVGVQELKKTSIFLRPHVAAISEERKQR